MSAWPSVSLGDVATITREGVDPARIDDGTLYVGLENIRSGGDLIDVAPVARGDLASTKFRFTPDHVLFGKLRPYLAKVARPPFSGICSTDILPILPGANLDRDYLAHFLLRPESVAWAASRSAGANLPRLTPSSLTQMRISMPPLEEQRRVAGLLDRVDALRAKRSAALALADTLAESVYLDMFGDPVSNSRTWATSPFGSLCSRVTVGIVVRPASYYVGAGVPALRSLNVRPGEIALNDLVFFSEQDNERILGKTRLRSGDIVLVRSGRPGTAAVIPPELDGVNAIDLLIATPDRAKGVAEFYCAYFNSAGGRRMVRGAERGQVQKHLNVSSLSQAAVPCPPLALQKEFSRRLEEQSRLLGAQQASLAEAELLQASLQHHAFTGRL